MKFTCVLLVSAFLIFSCQRKQTNSTDRLNDTAMFVNDPHSFAKPSQAVTRHMVLDLTVDFEKKIITGKAAASIHTTDHAQQVIFDTRGLAIEKVLVDDAAATYSLGDDDKILGKPLIVSLPQSNKDQF